MDYRRFAGVLLLLLLFSVTLSPPALAQGVAPASLVPGDVSFYFQVRADENLEANLQEIRRLSNALSVKPEEVFENIVKPEEASLIDGLLADALPNLEFSADIEPWLGDQVAMAAFGDLTSDDEERNNFVLVAPIVDAARAEAFLSGLTAPLPEATSIGDASVFDLPERGFQLAVTPDTVYVGAPDALEWVMAVRSGESAALLDDARFLATWTALPDDALVAGYVSGQWMWNEMSETERLEAQRGLEIVLRVHPAESEMEDALIASQGLNGLGFAVDLTEERLDFTGVLSMDAEYRAPTLPSESAGASMLQYVPGDAVVAFASYDASVTIGGLGGLVLLGPQIGAVFDSIVTSLETGATPVPTPTPPPTPTVDETVEEARQEFQQVEAMLGISLEELSELLSGEYVFAIFPTETELVDSGVNVGTALWLRTSDPARLGEVVDKGLSVATAQSGGASQVIRTERPVNGVDVVTWRDSQMGDVFAHGILGEDVFFLTTSSGVEEVTAAARGDGVLPQSEAWPAALVAEYGAGQEMLFYMNLHEAPAVMGMPGSSPGMEAFEALLLSLDLRDDGLFVLRVTGVRAG